MKTVKTVRTYFHRSRRIGFSSWSLTDRTLAQGLWGDAEVTRYHGGNWSAQQIDDRLAAEVEMLERDGIQYWPIFLLETGDHMGCCGFHHRDTSERTLELGCHLRRRYWSNALGREAAQTIIAYAFGVLNAAAIFARHHPLNLASRQFLQRLGFRYTHDEFYQATQIVEPCYLLSRPLG